MSFIFFPLKIEHLNEVLEIEGKSFPQPWTRGMFEREISLPISHFFVAQVDGHIAGYGGYWQIESEAHLINLAVHPAHRSRGIGRQILNYLVNSMSRQNICRILLEVRRSNGPAQQLYASLGFSVTGQRRNYYTTEDAILMEKTVEASVGAANRAAGTGKKP
jgi:ribosomal-protein-alanine N-acetyltransferase